MHKGYTLLHRRLKGKIESVRTHSEVFEQFDSFSLLRLLFLVRNWHCWSQQAFTSPNDTPKPTKKNCENGLSSTSPTGMKSCTVDRGCTPAPKDATKQAVFFRFFESFLWHFNKKQRAEVGLQLSRPVSWKNQENGSWKHWSLHAPLNLRGKTAALWTLERMAPEKFENTNKARATRGGGGGWGDHTKDDNWSRAACLCEAGLGMGYVWQSPWLRCLEWLKRDQNRRWYSVLLWLLSWTAALVLLLVLLARWAAFSVDLHNKHWECMHISGTETKL